VAPNKQAADLVFEAMADIEDQILDDDEIIYGKYFFKM
jgi:hypothetical protein